MYVIVQLKIKDCKRRFYLLRFILFAVLSCFSVLRGRAGNTMQICRNYLKIQVVTAKDGMS